MSPSSCAPAPWPTLPPPVRAELADLAARLTRLDRQAAARRNLWVRAAGDADAPPEFVAELRAEAEHAEKQAVALWQLARTLEAELRVAPATAP